MPKIQFLGTFPSKEGVLARTLERGGRDFSSGFFGSLQEGRARKEREAGRAQQESQFTRQFGLQQQQLENQKDFQNEQLQAGIRRENLAQDRFSETSRRGALREQATAEHRGKVLKLQERAMEIGQGEEEDKIKKQKMELLRDTFILDMKKSQFSLKQEEVKGGTKLQTEAQKTIRSWFAAGKGEAFLGTVDGQRLLGILGDDASGYKTLVDLERASNKIKGIKTPRPLSQSGFKQANELLRARATEKADIGRGHLGRLFTGTGTERDAATRSLEDEQLRRQGLLGGGEQFGGQQFGPTATSQGANLPPEIREFMTSPDGQALIKMARNGSKRAQDRLDAMKVPWRGS